MLFRMRRIAVGLAALLVIGACGKSNSDGSAAAPSSSTTTSVPATPGAAFPDNVPTESDGECSLPRTDPARPKAGPLGKVTDGVSVSQVDVFDDGPGSVVVDFTVSAPPYVNASSGERWVVITLDGVRRFDRVANLGSSHARRLPATICDDSSWAFAFAFDREIDRLSLENEAAPRLRVFLKS
jgi:hypothetical protein